MDIFNRRGADGLPSRDDDDEWSREWNGDTAWQPRRTSGRTSGRQWWDEVLSAAQLLQRLGINRQPSRYTPSGLCHTSGCIRPAMIGLFCGECATRRIYIAAMEGDAALEQLPTRTPTEMEIPALPAMLPESPESPMPPLPEPPAVLQEAQPSPLPYWLDADCRICRHILIEHGRRPRALTAEQFHARFVNDPDFTHYRCPRHTTVK